MKYLLFGTNVHGHNLEYIHHVYMKFSCLPEHELCVHVPSTIKEKYDMMKWPSCTNIIFSYFDETKMRKEKPLQDAFYATLELRRACKIHHPDKVLLIVMMVVMPFVSFMLPPKIKVSGIIYNIYLYEWKRSNWKKRLEDIIKYFSFSHFDIFDKIFILNDKVSAVKLNKIWKTSKFEYLPDPCMIIEGGKNVRQDYDIPEENTVFLHMGSMTRRKGSLDILDIIGALNDKEADKTTFIFAGKIWHDIKEEFYEKYETIPKTKPQVLVYDMFCSYNFLADLCFSSDYLLLPYYNTSNSSGVISYGAQFSCPVLTRSGGMISKLVRRFHIGAIINEDFKEEFLKMLPVLKNKNVTSSKEYLDTHKVEQFQDVLIPLK